MKRKYYGFHRSTIYKRLLRQRRAYYAAMEEQPIAVTSSVANESPKLQMPEIMPDVSTELPVVAGTVGKVEGRCLTTDLREFCLRVKLSLTTAKDLFQVLRRYHPQLPNDPRTLLRTARTCVSKSLKRGKYVHLGLDRGLLDELRLCGVQKILTISPVPSRASWVGARGSVNLYVSTAIISTEFSQQVQKDMADIKGQLVNTNVRLAAFEKRNDFLAEQLMALHSCALQMQATLSDVVNALQRASSAGSRRRRFCKRGGGRNEADFFRNLLTVLLGPPLCHNFCWAGGSKEKKYFMACPLFLSLKMPLPNIPVLATAL
nr:unnamed protein product [Spirometra erinaceieuropaei]